MKAMRERNIEFPLPVLLRMMSQACEALHHAHQAKGLDQRPLKLVLGCIAKPSCSMFTAICESSTLVLQGGWRGHDPPRAGQGTVSLYAA